MVSAGEAIEIHAAASGDELSIEVADGGCGIPSEALERIFDRFAHVDAARSRAHGGVGLGLAIVDAIAKAHNGRCTVRSGPGGSTFALHLPGWRAKPQQASLGDRVEVVG